MAGISVSIIHDGSGGLPTSPQTPDTFLRGLIPSLVTRRGFPVDWKVNLSQGEAAATTTNAWEVRL